MNWAPLFFILLIRAVGYAQVTQKHAAEQVTERFLAAVESGDPRAALFCPDAILLATVQIERRGRDIRKYFDYFAKLPNLHVVERTKSASWSRTFTSTPRS